jgi:hypothetical protein
MPFHELFYGPLSTIPKKTVLAHSLGNHVALDMLRLSTYTHPSTPPVQRYIMIEAAVPRETLVPIPAGEEDDARRNSWKELFRRSIRPDILASNVFNTGDKIVMKYAMETAQKTKTTLGSFLNPVDCDDVISKNPYRIPGTIGFCILPGKPDGEPMAIGLEAIGNSYKPSNLFNANSRKLLEENNDEGFKEQHSYYALDPLFHTSHVYDRILNRVQWNDDP